MSTLCVSTPEIDFNILCWFLVYCSSFRALLYRRPPLEAIWLSGVLLHVVLVHSQTFHEVCDSLISIFDCVSIDTFFFPGSIATPFLVRCSKHVFAFTTLLAHAISSSVSRRKLFQYPWDFFFLHWMARAPFLHWSSTLIQARTPDTTPCVQDSTETVLSVRVFIFFWFNLCSAPLFFCEPWTCRLKKPFRHWRLNT